MNFYLGLILLLGSRSVIAHYIFPTLRINGTVSEKWQYVRNLTTNWAYVPDGPKEQWNPYYDVYDDNIRCGPGAATSGRGVETAQVVAGEEIGFVVYSGDYGDDGTIYHEGIAQSYLSKVDGDLESYTGDRDWFKIGSILAKNDTKWIIQNEKEMNFTIPRTTPPGKYLMRAEQMFMFNSQFNHTQFYIACAHIEVTGPGGGTPGPMVKFPGAYDLWDTAIWAPWLIGNVPPSNLTMYTPPGPPVWSG